MIYALVTIIVTVVGFAASALYFYPRVDIIADGKFDPESPFPASVTITNSGNIPLDDISVRMRPTRVETDGGGKLIGSSSGPGGDYSA